MVTGKLVKKIYRKNRKSKNMNNKCKTKRLKDGGMGTTRTRDSLIKTRQKTLFGALLVLANDMVVSDAKMPIIIR